MVGAIGPLYTFTQIGIRPGAQLASHPAHTTLPRPKPPMPPNIPTYSKGSPPAVNCWQCRHFATSWDPALPYSCKLLGFKSRMLPCMQVLQLDGRACQGFEPKTAGASAKVSANRQ